jgi:hypothetical protein
MNNKYNTFLKLFYLVNTMSTEAKIYKPMLSGVSEFVLKRIHGLHPELPDLPTREEIKPVMQIIKGNRIIHRAVRESLKGKKPSLGRGFLDHLLPVSVTAAYAAFKECESLCIDMDKRDEVIRDAALLGVLHDICRDRGYGPEHCIEGAHLAPHLLNEAGICNYSPYIQEQIMRHDDVDVDLAPYPFEFTLPFAACWASDHLHLTIDVLRAFDSIMNGMPLRPDLDKLISYLKRVNDSSILQVTDFGRNTVNLYLGAGITAGTLIKEQLAKQEREMTMARVYAVSN